MKFFSSRRAGFLAGTAAAVFYGMNPLFALPLLSEGFTPVAVLFFRYLPATMILLLWLLIRKENLRITGKEALSLAFLGLTFTISSISLYRSYLCMDAGIASTILFLYPLMTALLMKFLYHERLHPAAWMAMMLALVGVSLLYQQSGRGHDPTPAGILLVLNSALTYAVYLIGISKLPIGRISSLCATFYVLLTCVILYGIMLLSGLGTIGSFTPKAFLCILLIALIPTDLSLFCTAIAVRLAGSTVTAMLGAMEPLTAVFFGVAVFHEQLNFRIAAGIVLILSSVLLTVRVTRHA